MTSLLVALFLGQAAGFGKCPPGQAVNAIPRNAPPVCINTVSGNAGTATAFDHNPTDCAAGTYATAIDAGGNLTCTAIAGPAYGELYETNEAGSSYAITAGSWTQWTSSTVGAGGGGVYKCNAAFALDVNNLTEARLAVFKNGVEQSKLRADTDVSVATSYRQLVITGLLSLAAGDYVDVRISASDNRTIDVKHADFNIVRVGP